MLFVPLYLQGAAWQAGFGFEGWCTLALATPAWLQGFAGAIWVHSVAALPWVVLIVAAGFRLVEPELEEEALLDGTPGQVFFHVTLPATIPAMGVALLWVALVTAGEMTITDLFAVRTYAEELYTQLSLGEPPGQIARRLGPGILAVAAMVPAALAIVARLAPAERPPSLLRPLVFRLGRWRIPCAAFVVAVLLLVVGVPLINLFYKAGIVVTETPIGRQRAWSLAKCLALIAAAPIEYRREWGWTILLGTLAATAAVGAGFALAWLGRRGGAGAWAVFLPAALCLALPGPLIGLGVIGLVNRPEVPGLVYLYDQSILAPWLALSVRALAPATLLLWHGLRTIPAEILDAAATDGAGPAAVLGRVAIPCRRRAIVLAWTVALAVALGDLAASILVVPPGVTTLSIRIFGLLHYGVDDRVAGVCLALAGVSAVVAWSASRLARTWAAEAAGELPGQGPG